MLSVMRKPKSCNHCRFLVGPIGRTYPLRCLLNIETVELPKGERKLWIDWCSYEDLAVNIKPKDRCPKPKSVEERIFYMKLWEQGKVGNKFPVLDSK